MPGRLTGALGRWDLRPSDGEMAEELGVACEARPDYAALAANEDDFASIKDDPRFPTA